MSKCKIETCRSEAKHKSAGLCHACYQAFRYWGRKSPTELFRRIDQVERMSTRFSIMAGTAKVARLKRKKKA